jgi:TetR/AcrR family transcriptional repressor of nem operon
MAYPPNHRAQVKANIIQSARRLFNRHGFDNVSLQQIMSGAGLTHGGFYNYFHSKSDLYTEVLGCFFTDPEWKNLWEGVEVDMASAEAPHRWFALIFRASTLRMWKIHARWLRCRRM